MLKTTLEDYRTGGIGALMDEYERAAFELKSLLENISEYDYVKIIDPDTKDSDCRSMQTMKITSYILVTIMLIRYAAIFRLRMNRWAMSDDKFKSLRSQSKLIKCLTTLLKLSTENGK